MFGMKKLSFAGAGAMGSLITGIVASHNWQNAVPTIISVEANDKFAQTTESHISVLWSIIFEPLLFGFIGSALDFDLLQGSVSKSLGILTVGILFRLLAAYFATGGEPNVLTDKERAFIALVWVPKATVQAALCSFPLMLAKDMIPLDSKDYEQYMIWGNEILSTAILSIVVTAPLGLIVIQYLGPRWLTKDKPEECDGIMGNKNKQDKDTNKDKDKIICHVSRMDDLIQKISLSSSQVETSCILAEMRQLNWKCKSVLNIIPKKDNA
jgi:NhaP-type Na+/H+ or K+/H+ antiporter